MRDYAGLAALFVVVFGAVALIEVPSWRVSLTYCLCPRGAIGARASSGFDLRRSLRHDRLGRKKRGAYTRIDEEHFIGNG